MTTQDVAQMVAGIGLPYAYDHFEEDESPGQPPYICFLYPSSDHFPADDRVYQKVMALRIELYTDEKDLELENAVEDALDNAGLIYESDETFLDSEKMYMVVWETSFLLTSDDHDTDND